MKKHERLFRKFGRLYPKGTYIFNEGDSGREMFYILSGKVGVEKKTGQTNNTLAILTSGDYFGEMAPIIDIPRTAAAVAIEDSSIAVIDGETFCNLIGESRGVSMLLLREFSYRLKNTNEAFEELDRARIKLTTIVYLLKEWPHKGDRILIDELSLAMGEDITDIRNTLEDLETDGVIVLDEDHVVQFNKDNVLDFLGIKPHR